MLETDECAANDKHELTPWPTERLQAFALAAIVLVGSVLRLGWLEQNGHGNPYYAAAVRSMLASGSNCFFGAFDPSGFITVDKPPAALWVQAASAKVFGYSGLSLLVPQAITGVLSIVLVHHLVRRVFGAGAGLLAALATALAPIGVAVDRDNLPDSALVLVLLLAAWALVKGVETGRLKWLLLSAALVGVGFNVKMLAAYLVLPTFYLVYLLAAPIGLRARAVHLAAATVVLAAVSLSWSIVVELTPQSRRPYMGGSRNNSALDLALGYNGLGRVFGGRGNLRPPRGGRPPLPPAAGGSIPSGAPAAPGGGMPPFPPGGRFRGGPPGFGGTPGPLRFASPTLAGQITWFFPLLIVGGLAAARRMSWRLPFGSEPAALLLWGGWLGTHLIVFSFARGIFHEYYTIVMIPAVAALAAVGTVALWDEWRREGGRRAPLPAALVLTAAWQAFVISRVPVWRVWLLPFAIGGTVAGVLGLLALGRASRSRAWHSAAVGLAALFVGPTAWSLAPVLKKGNPVIPSADPMVLTGTGRPMMPPFDSDPRDTDKMRAFLRANRHGERYLIAAPSTMEVAQLIINGERDAIALGGFLGADPVLSVKQFTALVEQGQLRFVLIGGGPPGGGPPGAGPGPPGPMGAGNREILDWVRAHGQPVDVALWRHDEPLTEEEKKEPAPADPAAPPFPSFARMRRMRKLYDCRPELGLNTPAETSASRAD